MDPTYIIALPWSCKIYKQSTILFCFPFDFLHNSGSRRKNHLNYFPFYRCYIEQTGTKELFAAFFFYFFPFDLLHNSGSRRKNHLNYFPFYRCYIEQTGTKELFAAFFFFFFFFLGGGVCFCFSVHVTFW